MAATALIVTLLTAWDLWRRETPWLLLSFCAGVAIGAEMSWIGAGIGYVLAVMSDLPGGDRKAIAVTGLSAGVTASVLGPGFGFLSMILAARLGWSLVGKPALPWILPWMLVVQMVQSRLTP